MRYLVEVSERTTYRLEVEAESVEEAEQAAEEIADREHIIDAYIVDVHAREAVPS